MLKRLRRAKDRRNTISMTPRALGRKRRSCFESLEDRRLLTRVSQNVIDTGEGKFLVGDFDNNGAEDLMRIDNDGGMSALDGYHRRPLQTWRQRTIPGWFGGDNDDYLVGDFNGDGTDDLMYAHPDGRFYVVKGQDASPLGGPWWGYDIPGWPGGSDQMVVGDFNGNGTDDLMYIRSDGRYHAVEGSSGAPISSWWGRQIPGWPGDANRLLVGDFDGNGFDDLMYVHPGGQFYAVTGNSASPMGNWWGTTIPGWPGDVNQLLVGDFNGNGTDDLMYFQSSDQKHFAVEGSSGAPMSGRWWGHRPSGVTFQGDNSRILVGDFDYDGYDDLVYRRPADQRLFVVRGSDRSVVGGWYNRTFTDGLTGPLLPLPQSPHLSYLGSSGEHPRVDSASTTFEWNVTDANDDLLNAVIGLQYEDSAGNWQEIRRSTFTLPSAGGARSLSIASSDLEDYGLGFYRAWITAHDRSGRSRTNYASPIQIIDDDQLGPAITLSDHLGQSLIDTVIEFSHGVNPSVSWSASDQLTGDSGISSVEVVVTKDGLPFDTLSGDSRQLDLSSAGPGLYEIGVTAWDNDHDRGSQSSSDFQSSTVAGAIRLTNDIPALQVGLDRSVDEGIYAAYQVLGSSDADGDVLQFTWDFGDGEPAVQGAAVNHRYLDNGVYTVVVTADDGHGGATTDSFDITVNNTAPRIVGSTATPAPANAGETVQLSINASDAPGDALIWEVDWDADGIFDASNMTGEFSHSFAADGLYVVPIRVTDDDGAAANSEAVIQVGASAPVLPEISFELASQSVSESSGIVSVTAVVSGTSSASIAVPVSVNGTATSDDYVSDSQYLVIPAGATSGTFEIEIVNDPIDEDPETLVLQMGAPLNAVLGSTVVHTMTIQDDDPTPTAWFTSGGLSVNEEARTIAATARLSHPSGRPVQVPLTVSGTSHAGDTLLPASPVVTIPVGEVFGVVDIPIVDDSLSEGAETVILTMQMPDFADLSTDPTVTTEYLLTIRENDAPSVSFAMLYAEVGEADGQAVVTANLSAPHFQQVTATAQIGGTVDGDDIDPDTQIVFTFPAGETVATQAVTVMDDADPERREYLVPRIVGTTGGARVGNRSSTVIGINDNDIPLVSFAIRAQTHFEANTSVPVEIIVDPPSPEDILIPIELRSGSATQSIDFSAPSHVIMPSNTSSVTTYLQIHEDTFLESDETINFALGQLQTTVGTDSIAEAGAVTRHTIKIRNDDVRVTVAADRNAVVEANTTIRLTTRLSGPTDEPVTVRISGVGTAEVGSDYEFVDSGGNVLQFVIPAGRTTEAHDLRIHDDSIVEFAEAIVTEVAGTGAVSYRSPAAIVIEDNERGTVSFGSGYSVHSEGDNEFAIPIRLNAPTQFDVPVILLDPRVGTQALVIPAGSTSIDYIASTFDNESLDVTKHVVFSLFSTLGVELGNTTRHEAVIEDDDRKSGYWGEIEYSNFINKRNFDEWVEHVEGFDPAGAFLEVWSYLANDGFQTAACSALGATAGLGSVVFTGGWGAFASTAAAASVTAACKVVVGQVINIEADREGGIQVDSPIANSLGISVVTFPSDGPIMGFRGFFDANKNGVADFVDSDADGTRDAGELVEPYFNTTPSGMMYGEVPLAFDRNGNDRIDDGDGQLVVVGGTDISTGFTLTIPLTAPFGSRVITPVTTIVAELTGRHGYDVSDAVARVLDGFMLPEFDLLGRDPIIRTEKGDEAGALVFAHAAMLHNSATQVSSLISGLPDAPSERTVGQALYSEVAAAISMDGSTIDWSNQFVMQSMIEGVAARLGLSIDHSIATTAAEVVSAGNAAIDVIPVDASIEYMEAVTQVQIVAQGDVASWLKEAATGQRSISDVHAAATGANLDSLTQAAVPGTLVVPEIEISDGEVVEGDSGQQMMEFSVSLTNAGKEPISVRYSTVDVNDATTDVDFGLTFGQLNWAAGESTTQTVQVPIYGDTEFEGRELFEVWIDRPSGAVISRQAGLGAIVDDDLFTYMAPSDGHDSNFYIDVLNGGRIVVTRNNVPILNTVFNADLPIEIKGASDAENHFTVSSAAANLFPTSGISVHGGNLNDTLTIRDDLATDISLQYMTDESGVFVFDGNAVQFDSIEQIRDTWTPNLVGGPFDEASPATLSLDFEQVMMRDQTTFEWAVTQNSVSVASSQFESVGFTPSDNGTYDVDLQMQIPAGPSVSITANVEVGNVAPAADDDAATTTEDDPVITIDVLDGDTDVAGALDPLTITGVDASGTLGTVAFTSGHVTYDPDGQFDSLDANSSAIDMFTYSISDGDGGNATGVVRVTINGTNDDPTVGVDAATVDVDEGQKAINTGSFDDIDTSNTVSIGASIGSVIVDENNWTWTLDTTDGPIESQTVTITATDNDGGTDTTTFDLRVNNVAPEIVSLSSSATFDTMGRLDGPLVVTNMGQETAGYQNSYGYYLPDNNGRPTLGKIVWANTKENIGDSVVLEDVDPENIGYFIIPNGQAINPDLQNDTSVSFHQDDDGDWFATTDTGFVLAGQGAHAFFSKPALNSDRKKHLKDTSAVGSQNWEDLYRLGDRDYDDINVDVTRTAEVTISGSFEDVGSGDAHSVSVLWDDGSESVLSEDHSAIDQVGNTFSVTHHYVTGGVFDVSVTVADDEGAVDDERTTSVVTGVRLTEEGEIQVVGTDDEDRVKLRPTQRGHQWEVEVKFGNRDPWQRFEFGAEDVMTASIDLFAGDDTSAFVPRYFNSTADVSAIIRGGSGNDLLIGGFSSDKIFGGGGEDWIYGVEGDDLLVGGGGNDRIDGGRGNDILRGQSGDDRLWGRHGLDLLEGGDGEDWLSGGSGEDALIAAAIQLSNSMLQDAHDIWAKGDSYEDRVSELATAGGLLEPNVNVTSDDKKDTLFGNSSRDLIFAQLNGDAKDNVKDKKGNEDVLDLQPLSDH